MNGRKILRFFRHLILIVLILLSIFGLSRNYRALKQVTQYETIVTEMTKKYDVSAYQDLILGILYTESKGKGNDPMQSSESAHGERNVFATPEESIEQGVRYFAQALEKAKVQDCDVWTAVQAYNYGLEYVDYVAQNGHKNTLELAESYSRDVLSPILGNKEQTQYRYLGVRSVLYNGGFLYHNGGNFFYAESVKWNAQKINLTKGLF